MVRFRDYPELSAEFLDRHPQDDPRFECWLEAWYGAPIEVGWWDLQGLEDGLGDDRESFSVLTARSWSLGRALVERFSAEQIGRTVLAIVGQLQWLYRPERGERMMWDAVDRLFFEVFEPLASPVEDDRSELGGALFMFWDVAGWRPARGTEIGRRAFLRILEASLASPNLAMQRSALHGIGEYTPWNGEGEGEVPEASRLGHRFIDSGKAAESDLLDYAGQAVKGMVQ